MEESHGIKRSSNSSEVNVDFKKMRSFDISFNAIKPGSKSMCLEARLTFKWFHEKMNSEHSLVTSWIDRNGVEFRARIAYNEVADRFHQLLEVNHIYRLIGVDVFYIWKDDSRMLSIKDISITGDSEISPINCNDVIYFTFPKLTYVYQQFPLDMKDVTAETRFNIDVLGVFNRWITEKEYMEVMTFKYEKLIIDVKKAIEQMSYVHILQPCQTVISIKGVRVEILDNAELLSYRCFRDSILTVGENCPESSDRDKILAWIQMNNEHCDEALEDMCCFHVRSAA